MSTTGPTIPPESARHVLWHFGQDGGWQPGSFTQRLMDAFAAADMTHTARLAKVYPDYAAAFLAAQYDPDGMQLLKDIAERRCTRCKQDDGPITPSGRCEACGTPMPLDGVA